MMPCAINILSMETGCSHPGNLQSLGKKSPFPDHWAGVPWKLLPVASRLSLAWSMQAIFEPVLILDPVFPQTLNDSQTPTSEPASSPLTSTSLLKIWTCGSLPQNPAVCIFQRREGQSIYFSFAAVLTDSCVVSSLQSALCITSMQCPTTVETLWEATTQPTAKTQLWESGTATMTPGISSRIIVLLSVSSYQTGRKG